MRYPMELKVNGRSYRLEVEARKTLLELIRQDLGLMGTKKSCEVGACGACTVLLDGKAVKSCLVLALQGKGKDVLTIEGLSGDGRLHPLQEAFHEKGAVQCGYCTPGMILAAKALLDENPRPTEAEVRRAISGNICRCTGYVRIVEAILHVAGS